MKMVKLKVPNDVGCVAFGAEIYPVLNGTIEVPESCAQQLLNSHRGYRVVPDEPKLAATVAQIKRKA